MDNSNRLTLNFYYFGLVFLVFMGMHLYHLFLIEGNDTFSTLFFFLYAVGESLLEVFALTILGKLICCSRSRVMYYALIVLTFLAICLHFFDVILHKFLDLSIYRWLDMVVDESWDNFVELLHQTGIQMSFWISLLVLVACILPLVAIGVDRLTHLISRKKKVSLSHKGLFLGVTGITLLLFLFDLGLAPFLSPCDHKRLARLLPWKSTLISPDPDVMVFQKPLRPLPSEEEMLLASKKQAKPLENRPNIYLFVVESLREDFINKETAQHVDCFRNENIRVGTTYSNANATQMSWYSIFHSNYPFYWESVAKGGWKSGSIPLQILKKQGYKVHVYSAAQLDYYRLSDVMFGKEAALIDEYHQFPHYSPKETWESDQEAIDAFHRDLKQDSLREGNVFVFFLDSTHFNYSWPKDYPVHFSPISNESTHFRLANSHENVEMIKNRYRNSIHYVDSLFGSVVSHLKEVGLYDESVILFLGDHGDEFLEQGQLFHTSHLSWMQIRPPIYYKLGDNQLAKGRDLSQVISSQVDLFPTVLHYLFGEETFKGIFQGESIFQRQRQGYAISARHNGSRAPTTFCIHNGKQKLTARFESVKNLWKQNKIEIVDLQDPQDRPLNVESLEEKKRLIQNAFGPVFSRLFY